MDSTTTDAVPARALAELADVVRAALAERYEHPIVVLREDSGSVAVLDGRPLQLAREAAGDDADRVVDLARDVRAHLQVPQGGLRLWRQHGRDGAGGELVTDLLAEDLPVALLVEQDGWLLVDTFNGARGWIAPDDAAALRPAVPDLGPNALTGAALDRESLVQAALALEGVPYAWGGTTDTGVDCSGLVVRAAWRARGRCVVPRHSRAMLKAGARVAPSAVRRGDVLVLQRDPGTYAQEERAQLEALAAREQATGAVPSHGPAIHPMHVAIALSADEVLHASRDAMRVVREPLARLRERYRVLGVRRLGPADDSSSPSSKDPA
jgi:hypothetical protein